MATLKQRLHRKNASGTYDTVYFETSADMIVGSVAIVNGGTGATTAANARTNLGITPANIGAAASSHTHAASNITSGTLSIARGGTGATTAANARSTLGITPANIGAAASSHNHSASNITSGTLPVTRGGTGVTSLEELKNVLGISSGNVKIVSGYMSFLTGHGQSRSVTFSQPFSNTPLVSLIPTEPPEAGYIQLYLTSISATGMTILNEGSKIDFVYFSAIGI